MADLLAHFKGVRACGDGWTALCPGHPDQHNSLSIQRTDDRWLLKCHAGCDWREIIEGVGLDATALFDDEVRGGGGICPRKQPRNGATAERKAPADVDPSGLTLERYSIAKALPRDFLRACSPRTTSPPCGCRT
jgi:hypothetical protein